MEVERETAPVCMHSHLCWTKLFSQLHCYALNSYGGGWSGRWAYEARDTRDQGLCPEFCMWLDLDSKRTLVKVNERLRFWLNVNKYLVSCASSHWLLFSISYSKDHEL